jgi:glycosyltransferase involved in cell wall biosynthesis/peptidoglycan/xylan/chitin deacetylase (PgdA/CDA1 family)
VRISVIVPTYNRRHSLSRVLDTLLEQTFPRDDYEIVVVDDGSTDGTAQLLAGMPADGRLGVVERFNGGPGAARNSGIAVARGELLLFVDDDCLCDPRLLAEHDAAHREGAPTMVLGPVLDAPPDTPGIVSDLNQRFADANWARNVSDGPGFRDAMLCANSSVPRRLLEKVGPFDERFQRLEDVDLGLRLWDEGVRVKFSLAAVARQLSTKNAAQLVSLEEPANATSEWLLCRTRPRHRRNSRLAMWNSGGAWKRAVRRSLARSPISPEPLLAAAYAMAESLARFRKARRIGVSLLQARMATAFWRRALIEAGSADVLDREFGKRLPVLAFHHVGAPRPGSYPALSLRPERFEQCVRWLATEGYSGISASDWDAWRSGHATLPDKPVLLTFDDAYEETVHNAFPVLARHGFRATAFVVTSLVGKTNRWDEREGRPSMKLAGAGLIREWAGRGIEFGAHSRTHPVLTALPDAELEAEVAGSAADLGEILGAPVTSFAYPYDRHDGRVRRCVGRSFNLAFDGGGGLNDLHTDGLSMSRSEVHPDDSYLDLWFRTNLGWHPVERARQRWARLKSS